FQYYIFVNYTFYHRKSFIISLSTAVAAAFNIGFNFIFIPLYGPMGAAYVTFFSYCLLILIHYFNAKRLSSTPIASFWLSIKWTLPVYVIAAASTCV
ncbi:polysaccharide biosynthesis C-terminal domain-containing protein, partial [Yersinia enterocolitica]